MPILIDGHNLLGAGVFEDIQLSDEDDEAKLVARLRVWKSRYRGQMTVVFDRGVPGGISRDLSGGGVEVVFATSPAEADDLIRRRIRRAARNLILVSNDDALIREAQRHNVATYSGTEFVDRFELRHVEPTSPDVDPNLSLSKEEVREWLELFGEKKQKRRRKRRSGSQTRERAPTDEQRRKERKRNPAKRPQQNNSNSDSRSGTSMPTDGRGGEGEN